MQHPVNFYPLFFYCDVRINAFYKMKIFLVFGSLSDFIEIEVSIILLQDLKRGVTIFSK